MVQIPIFNASQTSSKIPGVPTGVANPTAAAVLPYQAMANVGKTILDQGVKNYGQDLDFKTKKYEIAQNFKTKKHELAKNLQTEKYKISKDREIKEHEIKEKYALEQHKETERLKLLWHENRTKLERETTVKNAIMGSLDGINTASNEAINTQDTSVALSNYDLHTKLNGEKIAQSITDPLAKKLFELEYSQKVTSERLTVSDGVDKNVLANNLIAFQDEVDLLKNEALHGSNANIKTNAWHQLFGENSIFDKKHNQGMLKVNGVPVLPHVYKEIIKKEVFETQGDILSKNNGSLSIPLYVNKLTEQTNFDLEGILETTISNQDSITDNFEKLINKLKDLGINS